jgi:hypothetical protein
VEHFFLPTEEELAAELKREVLALECYILHLWPSYRDLQKFSIAMKA